MLGADPIWNELRAEKMDILPRGDYPDYPPPSLSKLRSSYLNDCIKINKIINGRNSNIICTCGACQYRNTACLELWIKMQTFVIFQAPSSFGQPSRLSELFNLSISKTENSKVCVAFGPNLRISSSALALPRIQKTEFSQCRLEYSKELNTIQEFF